MFSRAGKRNHVSYKESARSTSWVLLTWHPWMVSWGAALGEGPWEGGAGFLSDAWHAGRAVRRHGTDASRPALSPAVVCDCVCGGT